jgi:phosphatidylserine decarboxylase
MIKLFKTCNKFRKEHLKLHHEGISIVRNLIMWLFILNGILYFLQVNDLIFRLINVASVIFFAIILYFFRNPERAVESNEDVLYAPADGKVVVVEQTVENEFFNEPRIQVSIFMSPLNVHVNRIPVSGKIDYYKYHTGDYLVAWHPKSSTHNERTTVVLETLKGTKILLRQIAGAVARRVVCYAEVGKIFQQGEDFGFIKFGSRVDIFLPLDAEIKVNVGDRMWGNRTVIARLK